MKEAGRVALYLARAMVISRSSRGWRMVSRAERLNSGNSSRKRTPLCARLISPGWSEAPPPMRATSEMVWWGLRKGRWWRSEMLRPSLPATECTFVVSRLSLSVKSGRMEGSRLAIILLPQPGLPMRMMLWPPAAATSKARLTFSCPLTSAKSG